jgi:dihydrofolate synthase / folylpolyglutamate synthase
LAVRFFLPHLRVPVDAASLPDFMPSQLDKAFALLGALEGRGIHYDLDVIRRVLARRGNPERAFKSIIVAGTNGKGSTATMLHAMLRSLGYRTGLYTSPHLIDVRERIRIDEWIPEDALARWILQYEAEGLLAELTYYEMLTAAAFEWFREQNIDWGILEVGLGGRLDAVNVAPAEGSIIVSVDFDHREYLGDTIEAIAREKAGVTKAHRPLITGPLPAAAMDEVEAIARERAAPLYTAGTAFLLSASGAGFVYEGMNVFVAPALGLRGEHQIDNAGCALAALERIVGIDPGSCGEPLREALATVHWPARLDEISAAPLIVVDGAHNPAGARAVASAFRKEYGERAVTVVFATLADKEYAAMLAALRMPNAKFWVTEIPGAARAAPMRTVLECPALAGATVESVAPGELAARLKAAQPGEAFLVTGSLLFAGWFLETVHIP